MQEPEEARNTTGKQMTKHGDRTNIHERHDRLHVECGHRGGKENRTINNNKSENVNENT